MSSKQLKQAGLKVTLPRMRILEILHENPTQHLSAEDIYKSLIQSGETKIGLATVYRVLTQFETAGLVQRHNFEGGQSVFELDQGEHHDHIVCLQCGKIEEFYDDVIEQHQQTIARKRGFDLADHSLVLFGNCTRTDCPNRSVD